MKPKVVFISSSPYNSPFKVKRVSEFVAHGYDVEPYCFVRPDDPNRNEPPFTYHTMGTLRIADSYLHRLPTLLRGIGRFVKQYANRKDVLLYAFGLDVAMIVRRHCGTTSFIFEEADMTHTYISIAPIRNYLERQVHKTMAKALLTVFTSDGFVQYHCGDKVPDNVYVIANRLDPSVLQLKQTPKRETDIEHLAVGFVGVVRFRSIVNFASHLCKNYPQHEFHFFGYFDPQYADVETTMSTYANCHFHGRFKTPDDLPAIYSQLDLLLATYDADSVNARYAEPNKLYEAIHFNTPLIVTSGTFLAEKVAKLGIGFDIDAMSGDSIDSLLLGLTQQCLLERKENMRRLPTDFATGGNDDFFEMLERRLA